MIPIFYVHRIKYTIPKEKAWVPPRIRTWKKFSSPRLEEAAHGVAGA